MKHLRLAVRREDVVWMRRPKIAGKLVNRVVPDDGTGRHVEDAVLCQSSAIAARRRTSPADCCHSFEPEDGTVGFAKNGRPMQQSR